MSEFYGKLHRFDLDFVKIHKDLAFSDLALQALPPDAVKMEIIHSIREMDRTLVRMTATLPEAVLEKFEVKYPADWREALKERFFPAFALKRWPVRYTIKKFVASSIMPKLRILPGERNLMIREY
jgi:hypothetical protein